LPSVQSCAAELGDPGVASAGGGLSRAVRGGSVNERRLGLVDEAKRLRDEGRSHFEIATLLRVSLSDVRRALDPKAQEAHKRWAF
jgi:hypothetical protein